MDLAWFLFASDLDFEIHFSYHCSSWLCSLSCPHNFPRFFQCVEELGRELVTEEQLAIISAIVNKQMVKYWERKNERESNLFIVKLFLKMI